MVATVTSLSRLGVWFSIGHRRGDQSDYVKRPYGVYSQHPFELVKWVWSLFGDGPFRNTYPGTVYSRC